MNPARLAAAALAATAALVLPPAAAQAGESPIRYAALGDSFSSGTGTGDYYDAACRRSAAAYPGLIAADLDADLTVGACTGARTTDLIANQTGLLDAETDLVTVTVGGNDIGWSKAITACITPLTNCIDDIEATEATIRHRLPGLLDEAYGAIADRAPNAEVVVLGYPRLFSGERACGALRQPNIGEQRRMNAAADLLAEVVEDRAAAHGFTYVDVRDAFRGHAVCDDDPYLNGLAYPPAESYHPNRDGHRLGYYPALRDAL